MTIKNFKQAIHVGNTPSMDVFQLPCITALRKGACNIGFFYETTTDDVIACPGEWICEDQDGNWHVLSETLYNHYINKHETKR